MPFAGVEDDPIRYDLKTVPGGYVKLKRLSYGDKMRRLEKTMKQSMVQKKGQKEQRVDVDLTITQAKISDFNKCVVEHNLTYIRNGQEVPLNFQGSDILDLINGRVAEEIDGYIDELNSYEEDVEAEIAEGKDHSTSEP